MKFIIFMVLVSSTSVCLNAQSIEWLKTKNWKLFNVNTNSGISIPPDSLLNFPSLEIGTDSIHQFLLAVDIWPTNKTSIWMGSYAVTYILGNTVRKIDISTYGGFFFDESSHRYYQISNAFRQRWLDWWSDLKQRLIANKQ